MPIEIYGYSDRGIPGRIQASEYIGLAINESKSLTDNPPLNLQNYIRELTPEQLAGKIIINNSVDSIILKLSNKKCAEIHFIACEKPFDIKASSSRSEIYQIIYDFVLKASKEYMCSIIGQPLNNFERIRLFSSKEREKEPESEEKEYVSLAKYSLLD